MLIHNNTSMLGIKVCINLSDGNYLIVFHLILVLVLLKKIIFLRSSFWFKKIINFNVLVLRQIALFIIIVL